MIEFEEFMRIILKFYFLFLYTAMFLTQKKIDLVQKKS